MFFSVLIRQSQGKRTTNQKDDDSGLEVLDPDEITTEDISDASGSWEEDSTHDDKKKPNDEEKVENNTNKDNQKEDEILKDDIKWGDIY